MALLTELKKKLMLKRILYFGNPSHLSTRQEQLIIELRNTGEIKKAAIEDIGFIVLDNPQITLSQQMIAKMAEYNIALVVCDAKHHPASMLLHLDNHSQQAELFGCQVRATEPLKKNLWKQTVKAKIHNQAIVLRILEQEISLKESFPNFTPITAESKETYVNGSASRALKSLAGDVKSGDTSNREGHAAKIYWQNIFGPGFKRDRFGMPPNPTLNYGYAILRAAVARALVGSGLLPTLGIFHKHRSNAYCLADDIMEPYRPFVDLTIARLKHENPKYHVMDKNIKATLLDVLNQDIVFKKTKRPLMVGISQTTSSLAKCFSGSRKTIEFPKIPE